MIGSNQFLLRAGEKRIHQPLVLWRRGQHETVLTVLDPLDLEGLAWFNAILPAQLDGQDPAALSSRPPERR